MTRPRSQPDAAEHIDDRQRREDHEQHHTEGTERVRQRLLSRGALLPGQQQHGGRDDGTDHETDRQRDQQREVDVGDDEFDHHDDGESKGRDPRRERVHECAKAHT